MTRVMERLPQALVAVIIALAMILALGAVAQTVYAEDGDEGEYDDYFGCLIIPQDMIRVVVPGQSIQLTAEVWADWSEDAEPPQEALVYEWSLADGTEFATLQQKGEDATVTFKELEDMEYVDEEVTVDLRVYSSTGRLLCEDETYLEVCDSFVEIVPQDQGKELGFYETTAIKAELRHFSRKDPTGRVIDDQYVTYKVYNEHPRALEVKGTGPDFTFTRVGPGSAECEIEAIANEPDGSIWQDTNSYSFGYISDELDDYYLKVDGYEPETWPIYLNEGESIDQSKLQLVSSNGFIVPESSYKLKVEKETLDDKGKGKRAVWTDPLTFDPKGSGPMEGIGMYVVTATAVKGSGYTGPMKERYIDLISRNCVTYPGSEVTLDKTYRKTRTSITPFVYYSVPLGTTLPAPEVKVDNKTLTAGKDFTWKYRNLDTGQEVEGFPQTTGRYNCVVTGAGSYYGIADRVEVVVGTENGMSASAKNVSLKVKKLKKKARTVKAISVKNATGSLKYSAEFYDNSKSKKALKVNKKTGKITVKKKTKKGTYGVWVLVHAAGSADIAPADEIVYVKVKVKK